MDPPVITPSPPVVGADDWTDAINRAKTFASRLALEEKIDVTIGIDVLRRCVSNAGVRFSAFLRIACISLVSASKGTNASATWDAGLIEACGKAMGAEFRGKGRERRFGTDGQHGCVLCTDIPRLS
jgi:beta-glucosidase